MSTRWTAADIPADAADKTFLVTGANSGIGYEATRALAGAGAHVVMACRNASKAGAARDAILSEHGDARVDIVALDLADLDSVRACATEVRERFPTLDVLVNNAGLIGVRGETAQGFETTIGVNHLGPFALTGLLLDHLAANPNPTRVVSVASIAHSWFGRMWWNDIMFEKRWSMWPVYGQSKLCNLLFMFELDRRLRASGASVSAAACHPGMAYTHLIVAAPEERGNKLMAFVADKGSKLVTQSAEMGALPTLYAATHPSIEGGDYIGPRGLLQTRGFPKRVRHAARARRQADMTRLWELSTELTGVAYPEF